MVDAIGAVGPVIVVLCIAIGVITLIRDGGDVGAGLDIIKNAAYEGAANGETIKSAGSTGLFLVYHMPVSCSCGSQALQQHLVLIIRKKN